MSRFRVCRLDSKRIELSLFEVVQSVKMILSFKFVSFMAIQNNVQIYKIYSIQSQITDYCCTQKVCKQSSLWRMNNSGRFIWES